jgi:hypothetical protein
VHVFDQEDLVPVSPSVAPEKRNAVWQAAFATFLIHVGGPYSGIVRTLPGAPEEDLARVGEFRRRMVLRAIWAADAVQNELEAHDAQRSNG